MPVITVTAFLLTQGVNLGSLYDPTDYLAGTVADVSYLGVKHARAGWTPGVAGWYTSAQAESIAALAKLDILADSGAVANNPDTSVISNLASFHSTYPGGLEFVEGLNEINNVPVLYGSNGGYITGSTLCGSSYYNITSSANAGGSSELNAAIAYQEAIYAAVTGTLSSVGVIGFTGYQAGSPNISSCSGGSPTFLAAIPNTTDMISGGYATRNNSHFYPSGAPSTVSVATAFPFLTTAQIGSYQASGQLVYTETGYNSYYYGNTIQAQYSLELFLDGAKNQIAVSYLFTNNDGDGSDLYGLFTAYDNGSCANCAKPVAVAIHNMNTLLTSWNTGVVSSPVAVGYVVGGESSSSFDLEMTATNGSSVLALWNEGTTTLSQTVTLASSSNVLVYDPVAGTSPIGSFTNATTFAVALAQDPLLFEISPIGCAP